MFDSTATIDKMRVVVYPEPVLRLKAKSISDFSDPLVKRFCVNLSLFCKQIGAMGLSAPQIGVSVRVIVINDELRDSISRVEEETKKIIPRPMVLINPVITNTTGESVYKEGCVSLPDIFGNVKRFNEFDIEYQDVDGNQLVEHVKDTRNDIFGTIVQHEIEHLNGVLFIDNLSPFDKDKVIKKINKLRKR